MDRQIVVGDVLDDAVDLGGERIGEAGTDFVDVLYIGKNPRRQRAVDRGKRHLEAQVLWQCALLAQRLEYEIGVDGVARIADPPAGVAEAHALDAVLDLEQPGVGGVAWKQPLDAVLRRRPPHRLKLGMAGQHLVVDAADPMLARADLAIGHGLQRRTERSAEFAEDSFRSVEGDAADQEDVLGHGRSNS